LNRLTKIIGLTLGPKSMLLAEVALKAPAAPAILKLAEFPFPEGLSPATPADLGAALAAFLKANNFTVKDVIIGFPARRLLPRKQDDPAAAAAVGANTQPLQAEPEFAAESDAFVIDYAGATSTSSPFAVMLVATAQSAVDQCNEIARAAGLRLRGITATSAALGAATSALPGGEGLIVSLASGAAEIVVQHGKFSTQLRHLAVTNAGTPESISALAGEIRRTVAALHRNGTPLTLALWDDAGETGETGNLLEKRLGMPVTSPKLRSLATPDPAAQASANSGAFAPAVAVALAGLDPAGPPVDFLHSRLAPPAEKSSKRPILIASFCAAVLLLAIVGGYAYLQVKQSTLDALTAHHNAHAAEIKVAQTAADRLAEAKKWTTRKPRYIACLRDLTNLFPDEGTIWVTGLAIPPAGGKATVTGKALSETQVRNLKDKMLASKIFLSPTIRDNRKSAIAGRTGGAGGGGGFEQSFSIEFTYKPAEQP